MDNGMVGKIQKAKLYAEERNSRVRFDAFTVTIKGDNSDHQVNYEDGVWTCNCGFFTTRGVCSHTMAMERVLEGMIEAEAMGAE